MDYQVVSFRVPQQVLQLKSACLSLLLKLPICLLLKRPDLAQVNFKLLNALWMCIILLIQDVLLAAASWLAVDITFL